MRALIFANGIYQNPLQEPRSAPGDLVIAADGGSQHCQDLGITPDVLIGDLDSSDPKLAANWEAAGVEVIRHPEDKDQTDLELALMLAQDRGADEILVYGAVGGRLDMTFGNLTLLAHPDLHTPTTLICGGEEVQLLKPGGSLTLQGHPGEIVSLIPLQPGSAVVSTSGLRYGLKGEELAYGTTRGISNVLLDSKAKIQLTAGLLAVVHTREQPPKEGQSK
jgi:thiamine pyrophosphokinase